MIILGVDIGLDKKGLGDKGSSIVEFILCMPVAMMFFYGIVFMNSYFEKGSEIKINNRSVALSLEEDSSVLYEEFIDRKKDDDNDENNDQDGSKEKDVFSVELDKKRSGSNKNIEAIIFNTTWSLVKGKGYDLKAIILANSLYRDYRYYSNIEANENKYEKEDKDNDNNDYNDDNENLVTSKFRVHELSRKYLSNDDVFIKIYGDKDRDLIEKSRLKTLFNMNYDLYTELNSGYLNNRDYLYLGFYGLGSGIRSSWGEKFVDNCLMDFSLYNSCNGFNSFRAQVGVVAAAKTAAEVGSGIMSWGTSVVATRAMAEATSEAINVVVETITDKVVEAVEEKAQEIIKDTYKKKIKDLGIKDYEG